MNPVEYTISLQRLFLITAGASFFGICCMLVFIDPTENINYVFVFLAILFLFFVSIITLIGFWWFLSIKKEILTVSQVNKIVGQSCISSAIIVMTLSLQQTQQLNIWTGLLTLVCYSLYQVWANSK